MDINLFEELRVAGLISDDSLEKIKKKEREKLFSVNWELKTILSLGILLFSTGMGILVYKNINTIGHITIITLIVVLMAACFVYCFKKALPLSKNFVDSPNLLFPFILTMGCLLMLTFIGYIQFQYHLFGANWRLATFIPALVLFCVAYYFDNIGVLSMGIINLGAWLGLTVTPLQLLSENDFSDDNVIYSCILYGVLLLLLSRFSVVTKIKPHFYLTYKNFGTHLLFVSLLVAIFRFDHYYFVFFFLLSVFTIYEFLQGQKYKSMYFLVFAILYEYVGISYLVVRAFASSDLFFLLFYYFIFSCFGLLVFLRNINRKLNEKPAKSPDENDSL